MVIISRIRTKVPFWASIRWKILLAFFVVVAVSFLVAATNLTGLVRNYLTEQRTREDRQAAENLAAAVSQMFQEVDSEKLNALLAESAKSLDGRLLVLDNDGKVQYDTFNAFCGQRIQNDEAISVLSGKKDSAYGMYRPGRDQVERMTGESDAEYVAYCAWEINGENGRIGALLYVSRIQRMMDSQNSVQWQLRSIFLIIALSALILALILSRLLTNPIVALSRTMNQMGQGDLSVRAQVNGSGELRELAENYNAMAAQLESLDQARNQFVSNASHELKTPLASMKIMLETMIYEPNMPSDVQQEFMQDMNHEIDRLTGIITDLLTLTKMDNSSEGMTLETVDMSELTEQTVHLLKAAADKKQQTLLTNITPGLKMTGDRIKLNQILYNLVDNAMKYTPEHGVIQVSLAEEEEDLLWKVKDNGIGIPAEDREHIFERFYRVDKARGRESGGTGLGLSIVKQLCSMHGGTICVESQPGEGSLFTVRLPRDGGLSGPAGKGREEKNGKNRQAGLHFMRKKKKNGKAGR